MSDDTPREELATKVLRAVRKTGFPLEIQVAEILSNAGWTVEQPYDYFDGEELKHREADVHGSKEVGGTRVHVFIECKHSTDKQWVFFCPRNEFLAAPQLIVNPVTFAPSRLLQGDVQLPTVEAARRPALNVAVTAGENVPTGKDGPRRDFRSAVYGGIKASLHRMAHYVSTNYRAVFLPVIVFDGPLFIYGSPSAEELEAAEHVVMKKYAPMSIGSDERWARLPFVQTLLWIAGHRGEYYLVDVLRPSALESWLAKTEQAISSLSQELLAEWGTTQPGLLDLLRSLAEQHNQQDRSGS